MDFGQFEAYAISKGYEFYEFVNDKDRNGITYASGVGKETKYITLYDKFLKKKININYQTAVTSEILDLKKQIKSIGYKLYDSYFVKDGKKEKVETYNNSMFLISIFTFPPSESCEYVSYEIAFSKLDSDEL